MWYRATNLLGAGVILAAILVWSLPKETISAEPIDEPVAEEQTAVLASSEASADQGVEIELVNVVLPSPAFAAPEVNSRTPNSKAANAAGEAPTAASEDNLASPPIADTDSKHDVASDFGPPSNDTLDQPAGIHFNWPARAGQRHRLRRVLHQCLGAKMATLNADGRVSRVEQGASLDRFSQFARLVTVPRSKADASWIKQARDYETVIRLIPKALDQPIFAWLDQRDVNREAFSLVGNLELRSGHLIVSRIQLDQTATNRSIVLASVQHCG